MRAPLALSVFWTPSRRTGGPNGIKHDHNRPPPDPTRRPRLDAAPGPHPHGERPRERLLHGLPKSCRTTTCAAAPATHEVSAGLGRRLLGAAPFSAAAPRRPTTASATCGATHCGRACRRGATSPSARFRGILSSMRCLTRGVLAGSAVRRRWRFRRDCVRAPPRRGSAPAHTGARGRTAEEKGARRLGRGGVRGGTIMSCGAASGDRR